MNVEHGSPYEFGPRGHQNTAETQTPPQPTEQEPDDARKFGPREQEALLKRDQLRLQNPGPDAMRMALRDVHEARRQDEQDQQERAAQAAREAIGEAYAQQSQPEPTPEATPYPVHTTAGLSQRQAPINMTPPPTQTGQSELSGGSLREHVRQLNQQR